MPSDVPSTAPSTPLMMLSERLGKVCLAQGVAVTAAESCTGGGVAAAITDVSGSSAYFETGYVTYSNATKTRLLGVPEAILEQHGAVSQAVVEAMVQGACQDSGAELGVAISGVAGPSGGTPDKPVGLVWFAWSAHGRISTESCCFPGGRGEVREQAVRHALLGLIQALEADA